MYGHPGHNTQPHVRLPPSFLGMYALMTSLLTVPLTRNIHGSLMSFDNQALADVWSTGAGIKYLYCTTGQSGVNPKCHKSNDNEIVPSTPILLHENEFSGLVLQDELLPRENMPRDDKLLQQTFQS